MSQMTNFDQWRWKFIKKETFWLFWIIQTLLWAWENDLRKFEIHKNDYKIKLIINRWKLFLHADSRYLSIPQKIALASFYPLHKKSRRSQSLNELYNRFCEFQIFGGHFLTPTKESEWPRMVKMDLFASAFTSTGRYLSSVTLPVYLLHPKP